MKHVAIIIVRWTTAHFIHHSTWPILQYIIDMNPFNLLVCMIIGQIYAVDDPTGNRGHTQDEIIFA